MINMKIPYALDCHFGSIWIFDVKSSKPVWKWCAFKTPRLQQLTSASYHFNIKAIMYNVKYGQSSDMALQYSLSKCKGLFVYDKTLTETNRHITFYENEDEFTAVNFDFGGCFVLHALPEYDTERFYHKFFFQDFARALKVRKYTVVSQYNSKALACIGIWTIQGWGLIPPYIFGFGVFKQEIDGTNVNVKATTLQAETYGNIDCRHDDAFIVIIDDVCGELFTDEENMLFFNPEAYAFTIDSRFSSTCTKYVISLEYPYTFMLSFSGHALCTPSHDVQSFPCLSKEGLFCENITSCFTAH